ncbi:MAG: FKBP-type peptidyl-prolyl cis-trans isomerase [Gammaproteobacteria bacterium]|nr:FKBP-type peptidyl-prolyl cis-trans isomerase [Gammaproteobacteria bacterium]
MRLIPAVAMALFLAPATDAADGKPETVLERYSYLVGTEVGRSFKRDGVAIDPEAFALGLADAVAGREPRLTQQEMDEAAVERREAVRREQAALLAQKAADEEAFLTAFRQREGVKQLADGVLYRTLEAGTGASPDTDSEVTVHYRGTLADGTEFDSSHARGEPTRIDLTRVIPGWRAALPMMREGARWEIAIPAAQGYGKQGAAGVIGPGEPLLFEVELIEVH